MVDDYKKIKSIGKESLKNIVGLWKEINWKKYKRAIEAIENKERKNLFKSFLL